MAFNFIANLWGATQNAMENAAINASGGSNGIFSSILGGTLTEVASTYGIPVNPKVELAKWQSRVKQANTNMLTVNSFIAKIVPIWSRGSYGEVGLQASREFTTESTNLYQICSISKNASQAVVNELLKFNTQGKVMDFAYYAGFKQVADQAYSKMTKQFDQWRSDYTSLNKKVSGSSATQVAKNTLSTIYDTGATAIKDTASAAKSAETGIKEFGSSALTLAPYLPYVLVGVAALAALSYLKPRRS